MIKTSPQTLNGLALTRLWIKTPGFEVCFPPELSRASRCDDDDDDDDDEEEETTLI